MNEVIKTLSLESARTEFGYTQNEIADKLGVSRVVYNQWETGKKLPKQMVIFALAYIYGINSDILRLPK
ncbi:helix-turn-helix transcriptional regulator [Macrococcoides caseolyticum]|uniref:helix-turn-helix transcriptional regulator n=1 Tax=Macrococcoides caseolyticum TaxID=69966 RepID=UPI001F20C364|nr:helix-turn-helix transcriptional regulator [Macrococcus caseolyticus]MCE4957684.1 helix-turn-helix transcriptional regulator [Macrococcus caseolyticus]